MMIRTVPILTEGFHRTREDECCAEERKTDGNKSWMVG